MFGNGEEASETPVETGEESAGLEAGLPVFVATPCFVFVGDTLGFLTCDLEASELTGGERPFQLSVQQPWDFSFRLVTCSLHYKHL